MDADRPTGLAIHLLVACFIEITLLESEAVLAKRRKRIVRVGEEALAVEADRAQATNEGRQQLPVRSVTW